MLPGLHAPIETAEDDLILAGDAQAGDFEHGDLGDRTGHGVRL